VCIATRLRAGWFGVGITGSEAHPAFCSMGRWVPGLFLGVKWSEREVNHSPPSTAKVENERSYSSTVPICLHLVHGEKSLLFMYLWLTERQSFLGVRCDWGVMLTPHPF